MTLFHDEIAVMLREINVVQPEIIFSSAVSTEQFNEKIAQTLNKHERVLCVSDSHSNQAAKHVVRDVSNLHVELFHQVFDAPIEATMENALRIIYAIAELNVTLVIALGSGSVNDVCKYAAHHAKLPYVCMPTAASMNGYTAENASLKYHGLKQSFPARLAESIFIAQDVINNAPAIMKQAGCADACASSSALMDWKLSHLLLDTKYDARIAKICEIQDNQMHTLLMQGFAMTIAGSSAPASGGEHMLAHLVELMHPELCKGLLHGELIAYALLTYADYQHDLINSVTPPALKNWSEESEFKARFADKWSVIQPIYTDKKLLIEKNADKISERLKHYWPKWQAEFSKQLLNDFRLEKIKELATNADLLIACYHWLPLANYTRNRFTFLDLERK